MGVAVGDAQVAGGGEVAAAFDHSWIVARDHLIGGGSKGSESIATPFIHVAAHVEEVASIGAQGAVAVVGFSTRVCREPCD